nr:hypothetical protein [Tanacetum cinerariifolium]
MSSFYEFTCYGCGGPSDTPLCYLCTCKQCGNILIDGACLKCNSGARNSFVYDPNPKSFNKVQIIFNPPPQSHYNIYLCQICESNSHYGYECSQRVSLVYEPEPCYNQSFDDNTYPHDLPGVTPLIDHHYYYKCGDSPSKNEDGHLDTIPETKSNEFIKSSVENLVLSPSESEDLSDSECDVPISDDFTTFSNLLFDADDDFFSSDNESFSDEDISKEIYSNPLFDEKIISMKTDPHRFNAESDLIESLFNHDSSIISSSSKIDSFLNEFAEKLLYDNSSPRPLEEFISENSDAAIESLSPSPIPIEDSDSLMEKIDLTLTPDDSMLPGIEEDDYDSERDMLILEEFLSNDSLSLPENESFDFDIPSSSRPPAKPPDDDEINPNSGTLTVKVVCDIFEQDVPMPRLLPPLPPTHPCFKSEEISSSLISSGP